MRTILTVAVAALALAAPAQAQMWPGTENTGLEARLPTPVRVYCATQEYGGASGWTWLQAREIYLSQRTCSDLTNGVPYAYSYLALYHEWWHQAFQETNESSTNTGAMATIRYMLRRYWGFDQYKAQAFYDSLWQISFTSDYAITGLAQDTVDPLIEDGF